MNTFLHNSECFIYPGDYAPTFSEKEIREEIVRTKRDEIISPSVNIADANGSYKVEIALPGVDRENFLIYTDKNILSVYVGHPCQKADDPKSFRLHEFSYKCFERHIELPGDADTEFVSAEYKEGVLSIYVSKSCGAAINLHNRIVVY